MDNEKAKHPKDGHYDVESEEVMLEKHDMTALIISGFLTVGLPCLILILIIMGVVFLLFTK